MALAFPELGKHCSLEECNTHDFLPFDCDGCGGVFCLDHRQYSKHQCSNPKADTSFVPECPLCQQPLIVPPAGDVNAIVDAHITKGCPREKERNALTKYRCKFAGCAGQELVKVVCPNCSTNFCFRHRLPESHKCEGEDYLNTKKMIHQKRVEGKTATTNTSGYSRAARVKANLDERVKAFKEARDRPTARKVADMRLRSRAKGDQKLRTDQRFYVEVIFPFESKVQPKQMYFNSRFSVGKVLDLVAEAGNVENKNNSQQDEKLYLISLATGTPLPNMKTLEFLSKKGLLETGDSVMIERLTVTEAKARLQQ